jgi:LysR family transcriptional regulator, cell division regulator
LCCGSFDDLIAGVMDFRLEGAFVIGPVGHADLRQENLLQD